MGQLQRSPGAKQEIAGQLGRVDQLLMRLQGENLTWLEQARLLEKPQELTGWSGRELSRQLGKSPPWACRRLQVLWVLQETGVKPVAGELPPLQAVTAVARVTDTIHKRRLLLQILRERLSGQEARDLVTEELGEAGGCTPPEITRLVELIRAYRRERT